MVYSNLGDCRVCPIARHRSSWAGWSGHSRAGQATENCEQKVTNNMNPPVGKWDLNQSILSFCKIVRMLREKTQNRVCFSSWFASRVQKCGRWGWSQSDFVYSYQPFRQINIQLRAANAKNVALVTVVYFGVLHDFLIILTQTSIEKMFYQGYTIEWYHLLSTDQKA